MKSKKKKKQGSVTGFELTTFMTMYNRFIDYATNSHWGLVRAYNILDVLNACIILKIVS